VRGIGENVKLNRVVLDNKCEIPDGMQIGFNHEEDAHRFPCFIRRHHSGHSGYAGSIDPPHPVSYLVIFGKHHATEQYTRSSKGKKLRASAVLAHASA